MRHLNIEDIEFLAIGAAVLGAGGGGDPYLGKLMAKQAILEHGPVPLLDMEDVPDDALIIPIALMGAPAVVLEKLPNGIEPIKAFHAVESLVRKKAFATISIEAGGLNSCIPIYAASRLGIPLIDCDGMGRAFPEIPQVSFSLGGVSATPMVLCDEKGNNVLIETINNSWTETISRAVTVSWGLCSMIGIYPMSGKQLKDHAIKGTMSLAMEIGRTIAESGKQSTNPVDLLLEVTNGFRLFEGKITDLQRDLTTGFVRGSASFEGIDAYAGASCTLEFQNENLVAYLNGKVCAMVPDLITVLDKESGSPITTENLQYGQRVVIIGMPCASVWRTKEGLKQAGPRYFKYDLNYVPIEEMQRRSTP